MLELALDNNSYNLELKDNDWWTALCYAIGWDWEEWISYPVIAEYLLRQWAKCDVRFGNDKRTILMDIINRWWFDLAEIAIEEWNYWDLG